MSSIAYVTDKNMLEYHRINGSKSMNFWRLSKQQNFTDFAAGDLLFFLAKGTEKGRQREKGIIGYSCFKKAQSLSLNQMWRLYGTQNGYRSKQELQEAIIKLAKDNQVPKTMNCLLLEKVMFFQSPVYLSELGIHISKQVESYIYLDHDDDLCTAKILRKAMKSGIDMWTMMMNKNSYNDRQFEEDIIKHEIASINHKFALEYATEYERKRALRLTKQCLKNQDYELIKGNDLECIKFTFNEVIIAIPLVYNTKNYRQNVQYLLGHLWAYLQTYQAISTYNLKFKFKILSEGTFN